MTEETKLICDMEWAVEICHNWKSASIIELQEACKYVPSAVLFLIQRFALGFCIPDNPVKIHSRKSKNNLK